MRKLILVAEDDADDRFLLESAFDLSAGDVDLAFAGDGVEALAFMEGALAGAERFPKLVIADLNMPRMNGQELLRSLRADARFRELPVIIYTTTNSEADIRHCYELGANTYIVKPSDFSELQNIVRSLKTYWLDTALVPDHHSGV